MTVDIRHRVSLSLQATIAPLYSSVGGQTLNGRALAHACSESYPSTRGVRASCTVILRRNVPYRAHPAWAQRHLCRGAKTWKGRRTYIHDNTAPVAWRAGGRDNKLALYLPNRFRADSACTLSMATEPYRDTKYANSSMVSLPHAFPPVAYLARGITYRQLLTRRMPRMAFSCCARLACRLKTRRVAPAATTSAHTRIPDRDGLNRYTL